jgi:hypothetical protein
LYKDPDEPSSLANENRRPLMALMYIVSATNETDEAHGALDLMEFNMGPKPNPPNRRYFNVSAENIQSSPSASFPETNPLIYNGESHVTFGGEFKILFFAQNSLNRQTWSQTRQMILALRNIDPMTAPNMGLLFQVSEKDTGLPIMYLKMYPTGFFTTSGTESTLYLDYQRYQITYLNEINVTNPIPEQLQMKARRNLKIAIAMREIWLVTKEQARNSLESLANAKALSGGSRGKSTLKSTTAITI